MVWAVLADDFTGALDTGLQFARQGLWTVFDLGGGSPEAGALVLSSDSRALSPADSAIAAEAIARRAALTADRFYKKVDSTLRGNLGPELAAVMRATGVPTAVLAPAYPAQGRTTVGGIQYINGIRITDTEIAADPQSPVQEDDIARLVSANSDLKPALLSLETVRSGPEATESQMRILEAVADVIVADAETDADLECLAEAARRCALDRLTAGSAGLAEHLVGEASATPFPVSHPPSSCVAIIAGSFSDVTVEQVAVAASALGTAPYIPDIADYPHPEIALTAAVAHLRDDPVWIAHPGAGRRDLSPPEVEDLTRWIGELAAGLASAVPDIGLVLTGGETASLAVRGLDAAGIRIVAEVRPGIPGGLLVGGVAAGRPIVTKAGAFGEPSALLDATRWLRSA